jgi:hypothetical protein
VNESRLEAFNPPAALNPFKTLEWRRLTPRARLSRSW